MELRHLKYFLSVAEELHFGRAANDLNIAQPALSQQIKQLENELGFLLFNRTNQKVALTEAGSVFRNRANHILELLNEAVEESQQVARGELGQIKLGFAGMVTFDLLPLVLHAYREKFPNVTVNLRHLPTSEQVVALNSKEIDIGILILPIDDESLSYEILRIESFVMALPKSHPLANEASIDLTSLVNEKFIMPARSAGSGFYDSIINTCFNAGFSPKTSQEAQELQTIIALVASGMGISMVPSSFQTLKTDSVAYIPIQNGPANFKTAMAWNKHNISPILHSFIEVMKEMGSDGV